jgi:L-lactate dehydrogenase complex protein LldG
MSPIDRVSLFLENAGKAAAGTHRATAGKKLKEAVSNIVPKGASVFCPRATALEKTAATSLGKLVPDYLSAQVTVEEVHAAIAETGSIVITSKGGKAVQASLLPSHHVAIVPRKKIFGTLNEFFAKFAASPPTNITVITGPSRTADIELNLVIGVHGPEKLDIIVV